MTHIFDSATFWLMMLLTAGGLILSLRLTTCTAPAGRAPMPALPRHKAPGISREALRALRVEKKEEIENKLFEATADYIKTMVAAGHDQVTVGAPYLKFLNHFGSRHRTALEMQQRCDDFTLAVAKRLMSHGLDVDVSQSYEEFVSVKEAPDSCGVIKVPIMVRKIVVTI